MKFIQIFQVVIEALPLIGKFIKSLKNKKNGKQKPAEFDQIN